MGAQRIDPDWKLKPRLKINEALKILGISRSTFYRRRAIPDFPKVYCDHGLRFVLTENLIHWINSRTEAS